MKEYYIEHSGMYGPSDKQFIKVPDDAIILDYHVREEEHNLERKWFGLVRNIVKYKIPGVRYLIPKLGNKEDISQ